MAEITEQTVPAVPPMNGGNELADMKEALAFIIEQERIRGEMVKALDSKINALNQFVMDNIVTPSVTAYNEDKYNEFKGKFGDRLSKYDDIMQKAYSDDGYDVTKETYDAFSGLPADSGINEEDFVKATESKIGEYISNIKKSLGIPTEENIEIKEGQGNLDVKVDADGDGKAETPVVEETKEEVPVAEEPKKLSPMEEFQKKLDEWAKRK